MRAFIGRGWWVGRGLLLVACATLVQPYPAWGQSAPAATGAADPGAAEEGPTLAPAIVQVPGQEVGSSGEPDKAGEAGEAGEAEDPLAGFASLDLGDELDLLAAEDVIVSATRHVQHIEESPSAITVFTREAIRRSGADNLADLLRLVPGVDLFRSTAAQPAVGIRSNSTIAGDLILVLVDGRIALWPGLGQALWMAMPFDMESVERVEVIRGPGSSIYGANALQGVVNVITRRPGDKALQAETSLSVSEGDTLELGARLHGRQGKLGYWVSGGVARRAPLDQPFEADLKVQRARGYLSYDFNPKLSGTLELGMIHVASSFFTVIGSGTWNNTAPYLVARLDAPSSRLQLRIDQSAAKATLDVALAVKLAEGKPLLTLGTLPPFDITARTLELEGSHWFQLGTKNRLTVGGVGQAVWYLSDSMLQCPENILVEDFDRSLCSTQNIVEFSGGVFAQDEWRLLDHLILTSGLRLDINTTQTKPALSPRLALVWTPSDRHALRLSVGRAIRKPTYLESYAHIPLDAGEGAPADLVQRLAQIFATELGNPNLDYESVTSGELGYRGSFLEERLKISMDLFLTSHRAAIFMREDDLQIDSLAGVPFIAPEATLHYKNSPGSRLYGGGELTAVAKLSSFLDLTLAYAWDRLIRNDGIAESYRLEPEHRIIGSLRLTLPEGFTVDADAFWLSRYKDDISDPQSVLAPTRIVDLGAWTLVNLRLAWRVKAASGTLELGVKVFNLLGYHQRETAGVELPGGGSFGGMRLNRRASVFVEGSF